MGSKKPTVADLYELLQHTAKKEDLEGLATTKDIEKLEAKFEARLETIEEEVGKIPEIEERLNENVAETCQLTERVGYLERELARAQQNEIKKDLYDKRMNIITLGVPERTNESKTDCRDYIRKMLENMGVFDAANIILVDVHRLGREKENSTRPIIFKVNSMFAVHNIFQCAKNLQTTAKGVYIRRHLPKQMRDMKDKLKGKMNELYTLGLKPKWVIDFKTYTYFIKDKNGKVYTV